MGGSLPGSPNSSPWAVSQDTEGSLSPLPTAGLTPFPWHGGHLSRRDADGADADGAPEQGERRGPRALVSPATRSGKLPE